MGATVSATLTSELVGRTEELATLGSTFDQAAGGRLRVVLLLGEPGTGKTRLAMDFLDSRRSRAIYLAARGYPFGATTSFGMWIEALDPYLPRLLPEQVPSPPQVTPHQKLLLAIAHLLRELSATSPVLIVLDDMHLADSSSWEALAYLTRRLTDCRIMIVACARPAELDPRSHRVLLGMEQDGRLARLSLSPLGYEETAELAQFLIGRLPPATLVDWLFDHAQGNPLFTIWLLQELIERQLNLAAPALPRPPSAISQQVVSRLADLKATTRATLDVLAVAGRSLPFELLVTLTGRHPTRLNADLEELVAAHLVAEQADNDQLAYAIVHPLVAEAIYHAISIPRRRSIHRSIARRLVARNRFAEAATHFAHCASVGETEAVDALIEALHRSEQQQSPYEAMAILQALLGLLAAGDRRWVRVLDAMVWDAEWILDYNAFVSSDVGLKAMRAIERSLQDVSDPLRQAVVKLRLAGFSVFDLAQAEAGTRACREALPVFQQTGQQRLALMAQYWPAWIAGISGDLAQMAALSRQVIELAEDLGDRAMSMHAYGALGWALLRIGSFTQAEQALTRATARARELGNLNRLEMDQSALAFMRALQGRLAEAQEFLRQATIGQPAAGDVRLIGAINLLAGNPQAAFNDLRREASTVTRGPNSQHAWALVYAVIAAARLGRVEEAHAWLDASRPYRGHIGLGWEWFRWWAEGCLQWEEGNTRAALASLHEAAAGLRRGGSLPAAAIVLADVIDLLAETNDRRALEEAVNQLNEIAVYLDCDLYRALARLGTAQVELAHHRAAVPHADEAATKLGQLGYRGWEAGALLVKARALSRSNPRLASESLRRVLEITSQGGTARQRAAALRGLEQLGRHRRPGQVTLSTRERQVIRFAIAGLTARDIGKRLHISERTVESHLAHVYAKLDIRSRLELMRRAPALQPDPSKTLEQNPYRY